MECADFQRELQKVTAEVAQYRQEDTLVFPLFSDLHSRGPEGAAAQTFFPVLRDLCAELSPTAILDLGDNLNTMGRNLHTTNEELAQMLSQMFDNIKTLCPYPLFSINGNHDGAGTDFFLPQLFNSICKGKYDDGLAQYHTEGSYFFVDYPQAKTRLVFLSTPSDSVLNVEFPSPVWAFGKEQLQWLDTVALDTDMTVLLFCHVPFYDEDREDPTAMMTVWDGEKPVKTYIRNLCGWLDDAQEAAEIIRKKGNVVACFSGHTHYDELFLPHEAKNGYVNPLCCPQVVTTCAIPWKCPEDEMGIALDIVLWTPSTGQLRTVRFGDGVSRSILP